MLNITPISAIGGGQQKIESGFDPDFSVTATQIILSVRVERGEGFLSGVRPDRTCEIGSDMLMNVTHTYLLARLACMNKIVPYVLFGRIERLFDFSG